MHMSERTEIYMAARTGSVLGLREPGGAVRPVSQASKGGKEPALEEGARMGGTVPLEGRV